MAPVDGWEQYQKLVMDKLEEHDNRFSLINEKLTQIQVDIATLKCENLWHHTFVSFLRIFEKNIFNK